MSMGKVVQLSNTPTGFVLTLILNGNSRQWKDLVLDQLEFCIRNSEAGSEPLSDTETIIEVEDKDIFKNYLKRMGFTILDVKKLNLKLKPPPQRETISLKVKPKNSYINIPYSDISSHLTGKSFRGFETVLDDVPGFTVAQILETAVSSIAVRTSSAFSTIEFISRIEEANKILSRLQPDMKAGSRLDFLRTRRTPQLMSVYEALYSENDETFPTGSVVTINKVDWTIVDGHRIYDLIYKFGTKNGKVSHRYKDKILFRSFRGDYVFMVDESILEMTSGSEVRIRVKPLPSLLV